MKKITSALVSVFHKEGLDPLLELLSKQGVVLYSTGGTQKHIEGLGLEVTAVEDLTSYPSIFGGRVKTLHPKVFGGILHQRDLDSDLKEAEQFEIPPIDMVIVDLYPFEKTVASGASEEEVIEKIDIGGISLIRAAAKNYKDVLIISDTGQYAEALKILNDQQGATTLEQRRKFAGLAFDVSSHYDTQIFQYFKGEDTGSFKSSIQSQMPLRYGENPHQKGIFYGDFDAHFEQLNGKAISYNNLVDVEAALNLVAEFEGETAMAIIKHCNACGVATADPVAGAYEKALAADPVSAFGGILATNQKVNMEAAEKMHELFFEILIAPDFDKDALALLSSKKNRILLRLKNLPQPKIQFKSLLGGVLVQDADHMTETAEHLKVVTDRKPDQGEMGSLLFAAKVCKHSKSNTIVLARQGQLLASGVGQTSRVDALKQAIEKAGSFGQELEGAVMASDAFFPFPDCVEIAKSAGITAVIQPGGSMRDQDSIDFCNENNMAMVFTGIRHFKH